MTTYKQKLESLFETCVTAARKSFMEDGMLHTRWVVEDKHDVRLLIAFDPAIPKEDMLKQMRKMAEDKGIVRYAVEMEAWMALGGSSPPSQRPDRMEAIVVIGADRQGNNALVSIEIEHKGDKHYLGEALRASGEDLVEGAFQIFSKKGETK